MSLSRLPTVLLILAMGMILPGAAFAQTVRGHVTEAETREPVANAIILLLDEAGTQRGATLSDPSGAYTLTASAPGTYRLRVERVGFTGFTSEPFPLQAGETVERALTARSERVVLAPVTATGQPRRCGGEVRNGAEAATLWDEARKALLSTTLAAEAGRYRFVTEEREREVSLNGRRVWRDQVTFDTTDGRPFETRSADSLVQHGYVLTGREQVVVFGVDAAAILSDPFLEHHCFGVRDGGEEHPGMVGLEFVPLQGHELPDVQGVLWMDRATAELRFVEYGYTRLNFRGPVERLTGRLDFRRLPNGAWITESWILVLPLLRPTLMSLGEVTLVQGYRIWGLLERSGRVLEMQRIVDAVGGLNHVFDASGR